VNVAIHVAIQFSAIYLRDHFAYDTAGIGWTGAAASAGSAVIVLVIERIRRRWGLRPAMVASCALSGVHFLATLASPALWVQALSHFCRGGIPAIGTLVTVAVTDRSERANVASAVALIATTGNIAAFVMPPLGGWMYASIPAAPFLAGAGALAIAQGLVWITFRPTPRREAGATLDGSGLP
jgi:MFS family permease